MSNFTDELDKNHFQANIVLEIDGVYYSQYQVDSGLVVDSDKIGVVDKVSINGITLDIRKVKTSISSVSFTLLDKDGTVSTLLGNSATSLMESEVVFYLGFITGSYAWTDYELMSTTRVKSATKIANGFTFTSAEPTELIKAPAFTTFTTLDGNHTASQTTVDLDNATFFDTSGTIRINDEFITYTGKSSNQLTGCTRGSLFSVSSTAIDGDVVYKVWTKQDKAMNIITDFLTASDGLNISSALVDTAAFTSLRDGVFSGEGDFKLYPHNIPDGMKWLEENILIATNTRLFAKNGKISIGVLDQIDIEESVPSITEDHIQDTPSYKINVSKLINKVIINWDYQIGIDRYNKVSEYIDSDSISTYGEKKPLILKFNGVHDSLGGSSIVVDRATRLLARMASPFAEIGIKTHFNRYPINVADNVRLEHRYLPQQGGGLGFNAIVEVISRAPTGFDSNAKIKWKLAFTSYTGLRIALISPSEALTLTIISQKILTVNDGTLYEVGFKMKLWNPTTNTFYSDPVNTIVDITGNVITMENNFTTTLGTSTVFSFPDYDELSAIQKATYASIAPASNVFVSDGSKAYEIFV